MKIQKPNIIRRIQSFFKVFDYDSWRDEEYDVEYQLKYYKDQWVLAQQDYIVYSYQYDYAPFKVSYKELFEAQSFPLPDSFLLLGTGLGSALSILQKYYKSFPDTTMIEINPKFIEWSQEVMNLNSQENVEWINADAYFYLMTESRRYDLIGIDLFRGMQTLPFVLDIHYVQSAYNILNPGGNIIINMVEIGMENFQEKINTIKDLFPHTDMELGKNRFLIIHKNKD